MEALGGCAWTIPQARRPGLPRKLTSDAALPASSAQELSRMMGSLYVRAASRCQRAESPRTTPNEEPAPAVAEELVEEASVLVLWPMTVKAWALLRRAP